MKDVSYVKKCELLPALGAEQSRVVSLVCCGCPGGGLGTIPGDAEGLSWNGSIPQGCRCCAVPQELPRAPLAMPVQRLGLSLCCASPCTVQQLPVGDGIHSLLRAFRFH